VSDRPPVLKNGSYVPWPSQFWRFLGNKQEEGEQMWRSIEIGPYERQMITNSDKPDETIPEPLSKMTEANKKQYFADIKSKYVTMTRQSYNLKEAAYDQSFDTLSQFKPHVNASKAKKVARNHDPFALVAHLNVHC
nr:hypothetical protein [Tanacetum cinerariifolium]